MSQEFTDEELDAFEKEMGSETPNLEEVATPEVTGDDNPEPEVIEEPASEAEPAAELESQEPGETPDSETNPEEIPGVDLAAYLKDNPMEAKSKSARFKIDTPEKLQESINKSLDYHKKTAELSQWRGDIEIISQGGLTRDDLILLSEAKKGNKEALAALAGNGNIDLFEVSEEDAGNYAPTQHYATEQEIAVNEAAAEIENDPAVAEQFVQFIPDMPTDFKDLLNTNPEALRGFADDIRSGAAQKIYGEALSSQAMHGGDFLSHYQRVGQSMFGQRQPGVPTPAPVDNAGIERQPDVQAPVVSDRERDLRSKAAATTQRQQSGGKTFLADANSIWDMDEADFDKLSPADLRKMV